MQQLQHSAQTSTTSQSAAAIQPVRNFLHADSASDTTRELSSAAAAELVSEAQPVSNAARDDADLQGQATSSGKAAAHVSRAAVGKADKSTYDVPKNVIVKWGHVLDIVTPESLLTNCFTKTYTRFAKV